MKRKLLCLLLMASFVFLNSYLYANSLELSDEEIESPNIYFGILEEYEGYPDYKPVVSDIFIESMRIDYVVFCVPNVERFYWRAPVNLNIWADILAGDSELIISECIYGLGRIEGLLVELDESDIQLTAKDIELLSLARELTEEAISYEGLVHLGSVLDEARNLPLSEKMLEGQLELELRARAHLNEAYYLHTEFMELLQNPLPWPSVINDTADPIIASEAIEHSKNNQTHSSKDEPVVPPILPILSAFAGLGIYNTLKRANKNKHIRGIIEESKKSFNIGDALHTAIEPAIRVRTVKYKGSNMFNGKTLTVGSPGMRLAKKIHGKGAIALGVIDTAHATKLEIKNGIKTGQSTGEIAINAGRTAAKGVICYAGAYAGAKGGAVLGAKIGGTIGSIIPGPGTVIGAAIGGVVGSIAGSTVASGLTSHVVGFVFP